MPVIRAATVDTALELGPTLKATDDLIKSLLDDHGNQLSDAVFFSKLQELRREHKRSLKLMEDLYKEKLLEKTAARKRSHSAIGHRDSDLFSNNFLVSEENEETADGNGNDMENGNENEDFIRFLNDETREAYLESRRRGEPPFRLPSVPHGDVSDQDGQESMAGSYISDSYFPQDWENMSLQEVLRSARSALLDSDDEGQHEKKESTRRRHFSATDKTEDPVEILGQNWKPKLTVPVPFRMMVREERTPIRASYSQNFLHQLLKEQEEKAALERAKIGRGFRAKPVPATTFLPLYEELLKKNQERRQFVREYSKEMLQEKMKPFNVSNTRNGDHRRRCASVNDLNSETEPTGHIFKAKPVPEHVLDRKVDAGIRERELERQERKVERAEELLKNSKWPPNMQHLNHSDFRQALKSKRRHQQLCATNGWTFTPHISRKVPDFSNLHDEFQRSLGEAKLRGSRVTVPEPFDLRISSRPRKPQHHEMHKDAVKRHHSANRRSRSMISLNSGSMESKKVEPKKIAPTKPNTAALLREAAIKRQLNDMSDQNRKLIKQQRQKEAADDKMRGKMRAKLINYDLSREAKERERAEQRRSASHSSQAMFDQFKRSISDKLLERQSLLDRQDMLVAKQSIEKRYRKALESAGLKGASVATAMSSIEKLLTQDKDAAAAVSAAIESDRSIQSSRSSHSLQSPQSSHSSESSKSSSAMADSPSQRSDNTVTVKSKSKSTVPTASSPSTEPPDTPAWSSGREETEQVVHRSAIRRRSSSDVKDIFED